MMTNSQDNAINVCDVLLEITENALQVQEKLIPVLTRSENEVVGLSLQQTFDRGKEQRLYSFKLSLRNSNSNSTE
jgi:hypothetical protein